MNDGRKKLRLKSRGRFEPLEIQISRQTNAIEKHERLIAYHTAVQSRTNIASLIVSGVTTAALIYIAYQQYLASNRQVELEYAKVAPFFVVARTEIPNSEEEFSFPRSVKVTIDRGEATVKNMEVIQDFEIALIDEETSEHYSCTFRSSNYFNVGASNTEALARSIKRVSSDPSFFYPDYPGDFYIVRPAATYVRIHYEDIFGNEKKVIFGGQGASLDRIPTEEIPSTAIGELLPVDLTDATPSSYAVWMRPKELPKTDGCKTILQGTPLIAS